MIRRMNIYQALESEQFVRLIGEMEDFINDHLGCDISAESDPEVEREYVARELYFAAERLGVDKELKEITRRK